MVPARGARRGAAGGERDAVVATAAANAKPTCQQVAIDEIGDPNMKRSIPVMAVARYNRLWGNFHKWTGRDPDEHEEPTREQLSVVEEVFNQGSCHLDYALFSIRC